MTPAEDTRIKIFLTNFHYICLFHHYVKKHMNIYYPQQLKIKKCLFLFHPVERFCVPDSFKRAKYLAQVKECKTNIVHFINSFYFIMIEFKLKCCFMEN